MQRRRTPVDRMFDLMVAAPACTLDAARRLVPVVGLAVRDRLSTGPPEDHVESWTAEATRDEPDRQTSPEDEPATEPEAPTSPPSAALAIEDYDNLAARQVVDRLGGLEPDELRSIAEHERARRHRQTILRRIEQLLP